MFDKCLKINIICVIILIDIVVITTGDNHIDSYLTTGLKKIEIFYTLTCSIIYNEIQTEL